MHCTIKLTRLPEVRQKIPVTSRSSDIRKPAILITESERVTIPPAISFAFGKPKDRNTPNAAGATTAPKKSAAPNQQASKIIREMFRMIRSFLSQIRQRPPANGFWVV
jgi:hypothetical protein